MTIGIKLQDGRVFSVTEFDETIKKVIKEERERCAKIALNWRRNGPFLAADGNKPTEIDEAYNLAIDEVLKAIMGEK